MRKIDGTDKSIQSVTDEPGVFDAGGKERSAPGGFLSGEEEKEEEPLSDCGITCNILKLRCGCKSKEKGERLQNISFYDFVPEDQKQFCDATKGHAEPIHEPYYVTSDSIIITQSVPSPDEACGSDGPSDRPRQLSSVNGSRGTAESCVETANGQMTGASTQDYIRVGSLDKKKLTSCQKRPSFRTEEANGLTVDGLLPQFDHQPRFRLVSISVPTDTDTSLTSSLSESQLLSPNDSLDGFRDEDELEGFIVPLVDNATDMEQDTGGEPLYEQPGNSLQDDNKRTRGMQQHSSSQHMNTSLAHNPYISGLGKPALSSSPVLNSTRHKSFSKPHYLSLYPRSMSMETHDIPVCVYRDRDREAVRSSGSFSRCSPLSSSGLSTPTSVVDIPPPFELAYITKKPITKSSPSLLIDSESTEKNRKKKSSLKHFLMLKFRRKTENKSAVDVNPSLFKSSTGSGRSSPIRQLEAESRSLTNSPRLDSRSTSQGQGSPASSFLYYKDSRRKGSSVAFLNRSVIRVESFEDRTRAAFVPLPLTKPRSISFPNTGSSDYENVPPVSSDYENVQVPHRRTIPQGPFPDFFPSRVLSSGNDTDGYVDMSSLPGFKSKLQLDVDETERYVNRSRHEWWIEERFHPIGQDFRDAVVSAVGEKGEPALKEERLREILNELPDVYTLHRRILAELENRIKHWEENQRIADIFLTRKAEFLVFTTYIGHYDRSMNLLEDSCRTSPGFAAIVQQFEENLLRLVNIEFSVHGQRDLLQPGRMNDVLLYTYPQQDGKYRLKNNLPLNGLKVRNHQHVLKIEATDISITLSASSFLEREDWFYTLNRTIAEHSRGCGAFRSCSGDIRDCLQLSLGEKAPTLVPVSQVVMCMNCNVDFSLTLRRHHCHGCGRIVCRSCSRNRYPLKYMKDRMAKVCDRCYSELKKREGDVSSLAGKNSPRPHRSSRPLSTVFQNIHPPNVWRHRKGTLSFNQVTVTEEGSISGTLQRSKKSKRNWKRLWFLLKDKVLYTYRAREEKVASETLPLLGFTVRLPDRPVGQDEANVFELYHKNTLYYTFKAEDNYTAQRWANAMEEATVL
uniref:FYVE, RhoGEF and PH domain containing 5b n=1 Tax=Cynoglossus semilaevis TaxID=244447 RepID=A0A3P8UVJ1_CYNSE